MVNNLNPHSNRMYVHVCLQVLMYVASWVVCIVCTLICLTCTQLVPFPIYVSVCARLNSMSCACKKPCIVLIYIYNSKYT